MKIVKKIILSIIALSGLLSVLPASANLLTSSSATSCSLAVPCKIPGVENSAVYYNISKKDGNSYVCSVNSKAPYFALYLTSGGSFSMTPKVWFDTPGNKLEFQGQFLENSNGRIQFLNRPVPLHNIDPSKGIFTHWEAPELTITCNARRDEE